MLDTYLKDLPLIAILRGVTPDEIVAVGRVLYDAGFRVIEIPLNSPQPYESIRRLTAELGESCLIGAGTVLTEAQVAEVDAAGGRLIVSPNANLAVIRASKAAGLVSAPGVATPSEGFAALDAGADSLKLFPAEQLGPAVVKAWRAVFPKELALLPVGGITPDNMGPYVAAGANGFGLGSALYKPGLSAAQVSANAQAFAAGWAAVKNA
ncbi:2-dehydro-3-deoxy-6-phosphogalactonate aldolase [Pseudomonas oryzihabitans]|uniref:2-dehydro-3-deoxyphosphogalactonate aldolase n=1 Tax=Pseudomonas oryzihabitans TaxID=47885 RepID=A0A1G5NT13_9PSED|nr:2-dehydro-3-deoxy-6-phosphogalactonate aldolase [Pseudomonas psychrotolerans]NMY90732.1 2-dehydro-3-deoxy-6-phosphogalactonate aldolase [Pseudomonas psychrotolerans]SCZ40475.1 2-dehydro-3-deoxyphosphogalactonate aldolase [Pseudomonas psychrotolerans]